MSSFYGYDRLIGSFRVVKGVNDTVRYDDGLGGGPADFTIEPGIYYPLPYGDVDLVPYGEILMSIYTKLTLLLGISLSVFEGTATSSPNSKNMGVQVSMSGGTIDLTTMHESWRPLFGLLTNDFVSTVSDGFVSPYSIGYQVVLNDCVQSKFWDQTHEQYSSGKGAACRYTYRWSTDTSRELIYLDVPSALVRRTRAGESQFWADQANLGLGDLNANWYTVWDSWSRGDYGIIVHNEGDQDFDVTSHPFEIVSLTQDAQNASFRSTITNVELRGEFCDLSINVDVLSSNYPHE